MPVWCLKSGDGSFKTSKRANFCRLKCQNVVLLVISRNYFKLSRAGDCFLSLRFYGALTLKFVVIFLSLPLKVNLNKWHHNRYFVMEPWKQPGHQELLQSNFPQKKKASFSNHRWEILCNNAILLGQIWCGTKAISDILNSIVMFTVCIFDWKYPFYGNFVQKINGI